MLYLYIKMDGKVQTLNYPNEGLCETDVSHLYIHSAQNSLTNP